jgi:hypothetical protein
MFPSSDHLQGELGSERSEELKGDGPLVAVEERDASSSTADSIEHWKTGVKARFPWLGFSAILTVLLCVAFTIVILITSNGKAQEEWPGEPRNEVTGSCKSIANPSTGYQKWQWINDEWKSKMQLTPSTALAVTNTVANLGLAIAIANGVSIAWWRKAMQGATVSDLHRSWAFSTSLWELLTAGKHFNLIALAAITAKLALVDNILLQRSTNTVPGIYFQKGTNVRLPIVTELPQDYAGTFTADASSGALSSAFSDNVYRYSTDNDVIKFNNTFTDWDTHCRGTCVGYTQGYGFSIDCSEYNIVTKVVNHTTASQATWESMVASNFTSGNFVDSMALLGFSAHGLPANEENLFNSSTGTAFPYDLLYFSVDYSEAIADNAPAGQPGESCSMTQYSTTCYLRPSVLNYTIQITNITDNPHANNGIQLIRNPHYEYSTATTGVGDVIENGQIWGIQVLSPVPDNGSSQMSNVNSIATAVDSLFSGSSNLEFTNSTGYVYTGTGPLASWWVGSFNSRENTASCALDTPNPTTFVLSQLNKLMLRASISAAIDRYVKGEDGSISYNVPKAADVAIFPTDVSIDTVIYVSTYGYMGGAIAILVLCAACILPSYWGFWELGRKVALGPVEIATAFQAPALDHPVALAGGQVDDVLKEVGDRRLRYGRIQETGRLGIAEPEVVEKIIPSRGGDQIV